MLKKNNFLSPFKVLFIYSNINSGYSWSPAIQILSAVLKREGYPVDLIHIHDKEGFPNNKYKIIKKIREINPNIVLITATSFEFNEMNSLAGDIKKEISIFTVLGGIHATLMPNDLEKSNFDCFCIGEGEIPVLTLVTRLKNKENISDINSLWIKKNGNIFKNPVSEFIKDLDTLPFFDWEIMNTKKLLKKRKGWLSISFSRGCPFNCAFCVNPALKKIKGVKGYVRKKSVKSAISELIYLAKTYDIKVFNLDDDLLLLNKKWFKEFSYEYKIKIYKPFKIKYKINARADSIDTEIVTHLKSSGCKEVQIGVETGDENLRNKILKKSITDEQIFHSINLLKRKGINVLIYVMIGVPEESIKTYRKTVGLIAKTKPRLIRPTFFVPIPCTSLHEYCKNHNLFRKDKKVISHFSEPVLRLKNLNETELFKLKILLPWYINAKLNLLDYKKAIELFRADNYDSFKNKLQLIFDLDKELCKKHKGTLHYSYFQRNMNFLVLTK